MRSALTGALVTGALAIHAPASADVKAGVDAWQQGDYARAVAQWKPLAAAGDADAMFNLGQAYKLGRGVPQSMSEALNWFREAALKGHMRAEDNYGLLLFQQGQREDAIPYIRRSAERGDPRAQYILGTASFNGDFAPKDWVLAYALMTRAASAGLEQASASLQSMDRYIPEDQRQKGLALAVKMAKGNLDAEAPAARPSQPERRAAKPEWTPVPPRVASPPTTIAKADVPPSSAPPAPPHALPEARPAPPVQPVTRPVAPPPPQSDPAPVPVAEKPSAPMRAARAPAVADGLWRAQFGAFRDENNARALWARLKDSFDELAGTQPYLVRGTAITRLQAGGFATQAEAARFCGKVRAKGFDCLVMRRD